MLRPVSLGGIGPGDNAQATSPAVPTLGIFLLPTLADRDGLFGERTGRIDEPGEVVVVGLLATGRVPTLDPLNQPGLFHVRLWR